MEHQIPDITETLFILPPDAKLLPLSELSHRLRSKIGPVEGSQSVITRPGFRITTKLVPDPLAGLINEFREPSLLTNAVLRFSRTHNQEPMAMLDLAFDALATLVGARILVPKGINDALGIVPSFGAGQTFADVEIESLVRSLEDTEVYLGRQSNGDAVAIKIARDDRPDIGSVLANEIRILELLDGMDTPKVLHHGKYRERAFIVLEWCDGVPITVAAQHARAARDLQRLHDLVKNLLEAYGRLHTKGILHGDIHPDNCLVRTDGRVVLIDFGSARLNNENSVVDPMRVGLPNFYDPLMANALLNREMPPAATAASEQFSISVLAYMLMTGVYPIDTAAVQDELLRNIIDRPPLPFAARGITAWPSVEEILSRGLAKNPAERFRAVVDMADAFASTSREPDPPQFDWRQAEIELDRPIEDIKNLQSAHTDRLLQVWVALRASLAMEDAELLAAADVLTGWISPCWSKQLVVAKVAQAQSDSWAERQAIETFLGTADVVSDDSEAASVITAAAEIITGTASRNAATDMLANWASNRLEWFMAVSDPNRASDTEVLLVLAALSLTKTRAIAIPTWLKGNLELLSMISEGNVWLWGLAYDVFADQRYKTLALAAKLPEDPVDRGFAFLRMHQLTGDMHWISEAWDVVVGGIKRGLFEWRLALLMVELKAPEKATYPSFLQR